MSKSIFENIRCKKCKRLLMKATIGSAEIQIKCPKCNYINVLSSWPEDLIAINNPSTIATLRFMEEVEEEKRLNKNAVVQPMRRDINNI